MDALKSAGRALIRSPSLAKQSWGGGGRHRNWKGGGACFLPTVEVE